MPNSLNLLCVCVGVLAHRVLIRVRALVRIPAQERWLTHSSAICLTSLLCKHKTEYKGIKQNKIERLSFYLSVSFCLFGCLSAEQQAYLDVESKKINICLTLCLPFHIKGNFHIFTNGCLAVSSLSLSIPLSLSLFISLWAVLAYAKFNHLNSKIHVNIFMWKEQNKKIYITYIQLNIYMCMCIYIYKTLLVHCVARSTADNWIKWKYIISTWILAKQRRL